ncbi:MAG: type I DNA topoisomerase [Aurantimicrobium sp.]|uniref:type I DNA topoisomerase n=1 Tax=Aurantimicrobium sp. TaxID=1930784 RepID=UPI00321F80A6
MSSSRKLVIVESPAKAKTIGKYLGDNYEVLASVGHIRDLPKPSELPADMKKGPFGKFAVNVEDNFEPYYVVSENSKKTVAELKKALKDADELYLATDEDREGEAISWHLLQVLKPKVPVHRMVFHEITKEAIQAAQENTRELDTALVDAQETRRILDRLYGWEMSDVMRRRVGPGTSAGRVQTVALRLVVDRERERMAFNSANYWDLLATLGTSTEASTQFEAKLVRVGGNTIASGKDFDDNGQLTTKATLLTEEAATALAAALREASTEIVVAGLETKPYTRRPSAPFTTSTLQQEASRKLKFSSKQTMSVAQGLYENGYITYMRTDSPSLSGQAIAAARAQATTLYGADQVADAPRQYSGKSKNAQEAHEAIRPAGETFKTPAELQNVLRGNEWKLYDLIWKRTVASQMADAKGQTATVTAKATPASGDAVEFTASGTVITFRGFLNAYEESTDEERNAQDAQAEAKLPVMTEGQKLVLADVEAKGHDTTPPPRYTEATLVKKLEELGIGRPSTYASILGLIVDRGYVTPKGSAFVPAWVAFSIVRLMQEHYTDLVDYAFTAEMEEDLDKIAGGEGTGSQWLKKFYFGEPGHHGLREILDNIGDIDPRELNTFRIGENGAAIRVGKYGPYIEVTNPDATEDEKPRIVNIPLDMAPDELTPEKVQELIDAPIVTDRVLGVNPDNGKTVVSKDGRFGPYVTELEPEPEVALDEAEIDPATGEVVEVKKKKRVAKAEVIKPRTASLFKSMDPGTVDLETALKLLNLPREVGADPETGEMITSQNGRYGAYLKKGTDTRSLENEDQIFAIDLAGALELFAQPKYGARKAASAIKEFDADPESGKPIKIKDGRFGPYVTDGTTNATIPRGEVPEEIDFDRAVELLAIKRAKGPVVRKKAPAKKAAAKKPAAKKATKKVGDTIVVKKAGAKKAATTLGKSGISSKASE